MGLNIPLFGINVYAAKFQKFKKENIYYVTHKERNFLIRGTSFKPQGEFPTNTSNKTSLDIFFLVFYTEYFLLCETTQSRRRVDVYCSNFARTF